MGFNVDAALKDGYSFDEIADFLGKEKGINVSAARQDGWSSEEIIDQLNYSNKAFAKDLGAAVGRGVIGIAETAQGVNSILEKTSPLSVAGNAILPEWAKEKRASGEEYVREKLGEAKDWLTSKIHPQTKGELDKPFLQDGASWENISKDGLAGIPGNLIDLAKEGKLFAEGASSLDKIVFSGVESMPVSIVSMAPAGLAARGAYGRSLSGALASGMEQKAAEEVATKAAERTAMVVGGLSEGTAGAGMQFESTRQEVMDMKPEVLAESKAFQAIFDSLPSTMSEQDRFQKAKTEVADRAALQASSIAFLADAGLGALGDRYIGSAAAGKGNILSSAGRGLLQETPTEFGQSALEQFGTNLGVKINADPTRSLAKDVGEQAVGGALSGGLIGAGMGAAFHQSSRQRAESDLGASTNADQAIEAANRLASSVPELDSANSEFDSALADYNRLGSDLSVSPANQLTPDESIELAAAKGAIERTGSLDLSQPSPVIAPAAERAAAADTALRTIEANDGVATPAQAAIVDSVFPGRQNYDQVVGTSEQVPTVSDSPIIVENGRAPRETMSFAANPLQAENAAGWERFNAQRSNRNATQIASQQATTFDVANGASPVAETATQINVGNVIEALKVPAFQRTAEQTITLQKAEQTLPQADMRLLEKAANTPFQMGANDKVRLSALQSIPQIADNKGDFLQNTETAPAQENTAKLSTERDVTEDLPAAEQIMTFNQMGEGYTLLNQQQMPDGRTLYTYRSDSASANLNPQLTSAQNNQQVVNAQNNPEVVSQTGAAVPEVGTTMPKAGETDGKPTFTILRPDAADFQDTPIVDNGDAVGAESSLISDGVKHAYKIMRAGKLPALSTAVRHLMRLFNLDVAFFASNTLKADGFVRNDNGRRTIYINVNSTMSPVAVAFHEMFHLMRRDNPVAYQAVMNVVRRNLQGDTGNRFRNYYDGMDSGPNPNFDLTETELEEVAADLVGNSATTPAFLSDVIKEISNIAPQGEARSIILRLAAAIEKVVKAALEVIRNAGMQQSFATDKMVNNLEEIRAVIKQALVDYAVQQKESKAKMAMEFTRETSRINLSPSRENTTPTGNAQQIVQGTMASGATLQTQGAENAAENDTGRVRGVQPNPEQDRPGSAGNGRDRPGVDTGFGTAREGAIRVQGIHYSKQPLTSVDGNYYGTNVSRNNGAEKARLDESHDNRINRRGYFYINTGNGIKPEEGVGSVAHSAYLNNLYDPATKLIPIESYATRGGRADMNTFESAVLNAGFDGYINRSLGMAVVLGNKQVPVVSSDGTAEVVPAANKTASVSSELSSIKSLPSGELTRERWGQVIKSTRPDLYEKIEPTGAFNGEERVYKDGLVKFSPTRGGEQFGDFNVKTNKDGTIVVFGNTEEIRSLMPDGVVGRPVPGGVAFTTAQAPRAKAALEGRNVAYSRGGQVLDKMPMKNGKYVGAPEKFNTPSKRPHLRKWLRTLAEEGAAGRFWYENSGREVLKMVGGDVNEARKFVALLAIYSPQAKVDANTTFALRAWAQYKAGQPISVKTGVMDEKAQNAMDDVDAFWSGEKTGNFFFNLLREIDPNTEGKQGATIDMWMMRAGQYHTDAPTATQYAFMENETNFLAQELGWEPQQVQAAIWVAMKARMENPGVKKRTESTSEKKKWIRFDYPIKNGRPVKTRVVLDPQKHRDNWLKHAIAHDPTAEDTQLAKFDFGDGLKRHLGQLSFEARPGRSTGVLPGIHDADYEKQVEFQMAVQNAFLEEDGSDRLAQLLGLMVDTNDIMLPGVWQGEVSPSSQKLVAMAPAKGADGKANVDPAQAAALNAYAAIKGLLAYQEGVGWHRPFYAAAKRDSNGLDIDIGRQISPTEVKDLASALDAWMQENNKGDDWNNNFAVISTDYGVRLVNFGVVTNQELFDGIVNAAGSVLPDGEFQSFVSSGDMPTNDWKEFPNGQAYIQRASTEGSSDVFGWSRDVLAPRIRSVFQEFSERYGWGNPGSFDFAWPEDGTASTEEVTPAKSTEQAAKLSPPRFYSQLEQTVAQVPARISTQPAPQWKAWLASNAAKFGIKKDEIEWSGINDYLTLRGKDKVTAAELGEFLDLNNVKIEEVTKGGEQQIDYSEIEELPVPSALRVVPSNDPRFEFMVETVMDRRRVGLGDTEQDALSDAYSGYPEYWTDMNPANGTKYDQWVLPGGDNYREMLLTLPVNGVHNVVSATSDGDNWTVMFSDGRQEVFSERKANDKDEAIAYATRGQNYRSAHWDERNIVAHIRLNDRIDVNGDKVLFVEEIQSDWAQAGRKGGIRGELSQEAKARVEELRNQRIELDRKWRESDNPVERRSLMERANEISNKVEEIEGPVRGAVPAAPFISNTKDWVALAVKRVMLLAAQGDYDKVAFVTGEQSAARYSLAKQVDAIMWERESDGRITFTPEKDGQDFTAPQTVAANKLGEYLGKEIADKIVNSTEDAGYLEGVDLEVGGEGMKSFYNRIVPQVVGDVLKKLGGKMETVNVRSFELNDNMDEVQTTPAQPGFTVTPEMREKLKGEGLPLFSRQRTIEVNGVSRPTENSDGKPIAQSDEAIRNFWRWYDAAGVPGVLRQNASDLQDGGRLSQSDSGNPERFSTDEGGRPINLYHGTAGTFEQFEIGHPDQKDNGWLGRGIYLTNSRDLAEAYAGIKARRTKKSPVVMQLYAAIKNPFVMTLDEKNIVSGYSLERVVAFTNKLKDAGYDGVALDYGNGETELVAFESNQVKSATDNAGSFDVSNDNIKQSRQRRNVFGVAAPLATWSTPDMTRLDDVIYQMQDKLIDTRRVIEAVKARAGQISDQWNPYLQEELFHGRSAKQTKDFLSNELRPLLQDLQSRGVTIAEFEEFLQNRHAEERNNQIAKVNPAMPDSGSGISTQDARDYMANLPAAKARAMNALAARVDQISKETRDLLVREGVESAETIAAWEGAYQFYVPLMREDIDYGSSNSGMGTGQGYSVRGSSSKRATGSTRDVVDILANLAMQRERAIVRAEKNRVAKAVYGMAVQNPNTSFWLAVNPSAATDKAGLINELVSLGMNILDARNVIEEPTQPFVDPRTGLVSYRVNPLLRSSPNVLAVRIDGNERYVFFNQNDERSERMVSALKNLDADQLGRVMGMMSKITRYFASVNTQYNPIFGVINFMRDVQGALLNLSTTPLSGSQKEVMANVIPALRGLYADVRAERKGQTRPQGTWAQLWEEFQREGGQTGYRDMFSRSAERAEALERELAQISEGKLKQAGRAVFDWLSDYNETMENAVRLSAYKAALDKGMSKQQAASIAKNLTVNFNRKGQVATQAGALYAFFNAAVQGTARLAETMTGPMGKKIMAGGLILGTMQALLLDAAGFGEDEPPEFVRERNLVIPTFGLVGKKGYLTMPLPLGYHVIPNTTRVLTEFALSGFKNPTKRVGQIFGAFLDSFNPIGNAGWSVQTIAPTIADPLVALAENRDWTGKQIAKKDRSDNEPTPGYTRAKDTASWFSKQLSYYLNLASGGTKYKQGLISPTPDQLDYLIGQVTGGVGREILKVEQTASSMATGEELPTHKIPLVGRFYGDAESKSAESGKFYANIRKLNEHEAEIKGRRENREPLGDYVKSNPEARLFEAGNSAEKDVNNLRKRKRELLEKGASRESIRIVETQIANRMKRLNDMVLRAEQ